MIRRHFCKFQRNHLSTKYICLFICVVLFCFSSNSAVFYFLGCKGTSLLSGGRECVLVEWRDGSEKNKEFLPRLGSSIEHISVSPAGDLFCTSHSDNSKSKFLIVRRCYS